MKRLKVEDMKVTISYSENKVDKDRLCNIFIDIIKELEKKDCIKNSKENK